jgi:hypothetical protein
MESFFQKFFMSEDTPSIGKVAFLILDGLGLACMFGVYESCCHGKYGWALYEFGWGSALLFFGVMGSKVTILAASCEAFLEFQFQFPLV